MSDTEPIDKQLKSARENGRQSGGGVLNTHDPRFSQLLRWAWVTLGGLSLLIGVGVYTKLTSINDTLLVAVSDIKNQSNQVSELKVEVRDLRNAQGQLQRQVDSLEGKTLRGIQEITRGQ